MKIATVVGARPQFIKAAAVSRAISGHNVSSKASGMTEVIIHTGQHYDEKMSQLFFDELHIPRPDYNLEVGSGPHGAQTGTMLAGIEKILMEEKPDLVLTYGDTNSTLAGALAASKLHGISAHVEAGLRSYNRRMPEEINRIVADRVSNILFCPTGTALRNLEQEGLITDPAGQSARFSFNSQVAFNVGDVMYDSILFNEKLSGQKSRILADFGLASGSVRPDIRPYCLATVHRPENTDNPENLFNIIRALARVSAECGVVLPLHPRTAKCLRDFGGLPASDNHLMVIDPVGYLDMIQLEKHSRVILTDSGGIQKEAFMLGVPCVTLRNETEWVETVQSGWNTLAGSDPDSIAKAFIRIERRAKNDPPFVPSGAKAPSSPEARQPYGDGKAAEKIIQTIAGLIDNSRTE